jgi:Ethylbenzene dehydrogenase
MRSFIIAMVALLTGWVSPAFAVDWSTVPGKDVSLFYPGQSPWEWALTFSEHSGADKFRGGKNCIACHADEEKSMGALMVKGVKLEPAPIPGKPGSIPATVKFAYDDKMLYVRLDFSEGEQPNAGMDADFATKVAMMLGDAQVPEAPRAGCWGACHDDAASMPAAAGSQRTKYLPKTRIKLDRRGGGDATKSPEDLAKLLAEGYALEYWQARLNPGAKAIAAHGTIFDKRQEVKPSDVTAEATLTNGTWSVILSRPLKAAPPFKTLAPDKAFTVGFSIHSGHTARRFHYVSFEYTLALDKGPADFVAVRQ